MDFVFGIVGIDGRSCRLRRAIQHDVTAAAVADVLVDNVGARALLALASIRREVGGVEELREQNEVAEIHSERQLNVEVRYLAR